MGRLMRRLSGVMVAGAWLAGPSLVGARSQTAPALTVAALLQRAGAYLEEYEQKFSAIVAEEEYIQRLRGPGGRISRVIADRVTRGDMLLINVTGSDWVGFRDVFEVNGVPLRDHDQRLQRLFLDVPAQVLPRALEITTESARFNLGSVRRTINLPTMALAYLRVGNQRRSTFRLRGVEVVPNRPAPVAILEFSEKTKPTIMRSGTGDQPAEGRFWIDRESGLVLRSEVKAGKSGIDATIGVAYGPNAKVEMWVPVRMTERYTTMRETIDALAIYWNHRRFIVDSRVVIK